MIVSLVTLCRLSFGMTTFHWDITHRLQWVEKRRQRDKRLSTKHCFNNVLKISAKSIAWGKKGVLTLCLCWGDIEGEKENYDVALISFYLDKGLSNSLFILQFLIHCFFLFSSNLSLSLSLSLSLYLSLYLSLSPFSLLDFWRPNINHMSVIKNWSLSRYLYGSHTPRKDNFNLYHNNLLLNNFRWKHRSRPDHRSQAVTGLLSIQMGDDCLLVM